VVAEEFPKKSMTLDAEGVSVEGVEVGCAFAPSSTKPFLSVGITMSFFGRLTTPRLCNSLTSTIFFLFLKIIILLSGESI